MRNYELIEHTADVGIRVRAKDLGCLFEDAALAMFDIIAKKKAKGIGHRAKGKEIIIRQKADSLDELFINWLNELLSLSAIKGLVFCDFKIKKIEKNRLEAVVLGSQIKNYKVNTEIKAATYHQLKLEETKSGWQAEVIFDV